MSPAAIELILAQQLTSYLSMPIFVIDSQGTLVFYNEHARLILGRRFEETGEMPISALASLFETTDEDGTPLPKDELRITIALVEGQPAHRSFWIRGLDNVSRHIDATSFPLIAQDNRSQGAITIFWESAERREH